jgi:hypothetical protein
LVILPGAGAVKAFAPAEEGEAIKSAAGVGMGEVQTAVDAMAEAPMEEVVMAEAGMVEDRMAAVAMGGAETVGARDPGTEDAIRIALPIATSGTNGGKTT